MLYTDKKGGPPIPRVPAQLSGLNKLVSCRKGDKGEKAVERQKVYVGIDVAKASIDMVQYSDGERLSFTYDDNGINDAVSVLRKLSPARIIIRATGGIEASLIAALTIAGLPAEVINPGHIKDYTWRA